LSEATSESDPIVEVVGVSAAEILRRCAAVRAARSEGNRLPSSGWVLATGSQRATWRLIDFADGADEEFIQAAYASLLCRLPSNGELTRRVGELRAGSSRFDVVLALMLSAEGRRARGRPISGIALPTLAAAGRAIEFARRVRPALAPVQRLKEQIDRAPRRRS
jgi:hypothetical protein